MTDFRKLAETLADRLWDANSVLAYLNEKNIIDNEEVITKTWEILADARNAIQEPEPDDAFALAHEIWAVSHLAPGEGILDAVDRITPLLSQWKPND
jgi:hypothetical protein